MTIPVAMRREVWLRAENRCEYCQMPQLFDPATFEIDHVIPEKMNGVTEAANLALSCFKCNNHKGPNIAGINSATGEKAYLFDPRSDRWEENFQWDGPTLIGLTAKGNATISLLQINDNHRVAHRRQLITEGVFPPATPDQQG